MFKTASAYLGLLKAMYEITSQITEYKKNMNKKDM